MVNEFKVGEWMLTINDNNQLVELDGGKVMPQGEYKTLDGYCILVNYDGQVLDILFPAMATQTAEVMYSEVEEKKGFSLKSVLKVLGFKEDKEVKLSETKKEVETNMSKIKLSEVEIDGVKIVIPEEGWTDVEVTDVDGVVWVLNAKRKEVEAIETPAASEAPVESVADAVEMSKLKADYEAKFSALEAKLNAVLNLSAQPIQKTGEAGKSNPTDLFKDFMDKAKKQK